MPAEQIHLICRVNAKPAMRSRVQAISKQNEKDFKEGTSALGLSVGLVNRWKDAVIKWNRAGRPVRTDEEVASCLAVCVANDVKTEGGRKCYTTSWIGGRCKQCGCRVNEGSIPVANKIRMATEDCPLGLWPKRKDTSHGN